MNSANFASYDFSEVCISATWCLVGQLDAAVCSHRERRVPRHLPQVALGISEETMAPEEDLLCLLDYRGSSLGSFCEYRIHLPLLSHVVRQRDAREPAVLYIVYIYTGVGRKRRPREEGDHHPTRLEERHLVSAHLGFGPSQTVAVEGDGSLEVAHAEREEAHPGFHCVQSPSLASRLRTILSRRKPPFHRLFTQARASVAFSEVQRCESERHGDT